MLLGSKKAILLGSSAWWLPGSALDLNFQTNQGAVNSQNAGLATGLLTLTRATAGYAQYQSGLWQQFPSGAFRITDKGLLVEEARTNSALSERDLTNAAWVKVNMATALTATGIDGTANSATTLTASAGNATALQTIVLGSAAYVFQPFIKRISGTGNVDITVDGGVTWTTQTLTMSYQQFQVTKTAANPVIGIRIVTNGDSVAVDMGELQNGTFATSPVGSAATRNADAVTLTNNGFTALTGTWYSEWNEGAGPVSAIRRTVVQRIDVNNKIVLALTSTNKGQAAVTDTSVAQSTLTSTNSVVLGSIYRLAAVSFPNDFAAAWTASLNAAVQTDISGTIPSGAFTTYFGSEAGSNYMDGYLRRVTWFPSRISNAQILAWAQGSVGP